MSQPQMWATSLGFHDGWCCDSPLYCWVEVHYYKGRNYMTERVFCAECANVYFASRKEIP